MKRITLLLSASLWLTVITAVAIVPPNVTWAAAENGGYPWANAVPIRPATYEWGYTSCQPAMQAANRCKGFTTTKLGRTYYYSDPWRYYVRNCTSYVAWRIQGEFGVAIPGWGNANNWDNMARKQGYRVDTTPSIGAIAVWERNYGHVAYVTGVNPDSSVNIEQYNQFGTGTFSRQSRVRAVHYIHIKDIPPTTSPVTPSVTPPAILPEATQISSAPATTSTATNASIPQEASTTEPPVMPLESLKATDQKLFPDRGDTAFIAALQPIADEVNIFAVQWNNTASKKVEISRTDSTDGNSAWVDKWITDIPTTTETDVRYKVADANSDGYADVYILRKSGMSILSGIDKYKSTLQQTDLPSLTINDKTTLSLADYDGNGSLDLFVFDKQENTTNISILDGDKKFSQLVAQWISPHANSENTHYEVGDHDRDGRIDVYEIGSEVQVYSGADNYQKAALRWKQDALMPAKASISVPDNTPVMEAETSAPQS